MPDEPIGSVRVDVVADYSKFAQGVKEAADQGAQAGAKIAAAFTAAVSPAGTLTEATNRLKSAQSALTSEGAKMLQQVQATAPGYQSAQAALASLNAEVQTAQQQVAAATAAEQQHAAAMRATASAAQQAAAAEQQQAAATQAAAAAAQSAAVVQQLLGGTTAATTGAIMAGANATLGAANANNQLGSAQGNAASSGFRFLIVLGLISKALRELDGVRKSEMELLHMSEATGISAQTFAQFQGAITRSGGDAEKFGKSIVFLARTMEQGQRGAKTMSDELHRFGITTKDPIEAFFQITDGLHNTKNSSEAMAAATRLLGRGEQELIGIMTEGSAVLRENYARSEGVARARAAAIDSARQLTAVEAELKEQLNEMAVSVLPVLAVALKVIATAFSVVNIAVKFAVSTILEGFRGAIDAAKNFGIVVSDLAHGKWDMVRVDAAIAMDSIRDHAAALAKDVEKRTGESVKFISDLWTKAAPKQTPGAGNAFAPPAVKFDKGPETELRHQYQEQLADLKADHETTIKEELNFWQTRYAIVAAKGKAFADLAREIHRTIGTLNQQQFKLEGREFNKADDESFKEIEQRIKEAQEAAREAGGHPAKLKLDQLIDLTSSDNGISADTWKKLYDQIPAAQKEADKEATADLKRFLNEQDQAWLESGNRTAAQIKARAEATRSQLEELRPFFVGIDALIDSETAKIIAANKRIEAEKLRVADLQATNEASGGQAEIQSRRIALESAYALQANHTFQEQIAHQQQLAALEAEGLVLKRDKADADYRAAVALGDEVKIQQALNEQAAASRAIDLQAEQSAANLLKLKKDLSFSGQLASGLSADAQSAVSRLSAGIATLATQTKGWGQEFKNILKEIERSIIETFATNALKQGLNTLLSAGKAASGGGSKGGGQLGTEGGMAFLAALTANTAATTTDAAVTGTHSGIMASHLGVMVSHLAVMIAHTAVVIAQTIAVIAQTLATWALEAVEVIKAFFGFAAGGNPDPNQPFIAGENGPELIHPKGRSLTVVTADKTRQMLAAAQQGIGNFQIPQGSLSIPNAPASAFFSGAQAQGISSSTASSATSNHNTGVAGDLHVHMYDTRNPRENVRQITQYLKLASPRKALLSS